MEIFDRLKGNEKLKAFFKNLISQGTLAHAYILDGSEGSGRRTLALCVAQALAGDTPEGEKIARGISPDVKLYAPEEGKKQFSVDVVRKMREDARILPNDLPFKFYILDKTETMNTAAQNAALKILEEPPANTYFFLLCNGSGALLPTVRSRAPIMRMQRFSIEELDRLFENNELAAQKKRLDRAFYDACLRRSAGSYGEAWRLLSSNEFKEAKKPAEELLASASRPSELLLNINKLPKKRDEMTEVMEMLRLALRDLLVSRTDEKNTTLFFFTSANEAKQVLPEAAKEQIFSLCDCVQKAVRALERNANIQNVKIELYSGMRAALTR